MSVNNFLSKDNVELIWDVIMDEDVIQNKTKDIIIDINNALNKLIRDFYNSERTKFPNLVEMNKYFITLMLNYISNYISNANSNMNKKNQNQNQNQYQLQQFNQNNINQKEPITSEDIQQNRVSQFEKELQKKQQEFQNAVTMQMPPIPNFSDKLDEPIGEIEMEVKKMMAQRNYDVETFTNNMNKSGNENNNWLQSQETSIKNEKMQNNNNNNIKNENVTTNINTNTNTNTNSKIKYIKIGEQELNNVDIQKEAIDLNKKQISWSDNNVQIEYNEYNDNNKYNNQYNDNQYNSGLNINNPNNIFKKLKLLPMTENSSNDNDKINKLENKVDNLNSKIDLILKLLENRNII
jgi:hypothetical protein